MKKKRFEKPFKIIRSIVVKTGAHAIAAAIAVGFYLACSRWLGTATTASDLDSSIQLLTQVLAVSVTIMLVGVTVYSSSYDISDSVEEVSKGLGHAMRSFNELFFGNSKTGRKLQTTSFRKSLNVFPATKSLLFYIDNNEERKPYFIYRWDGVWYWTHESPFSDVDDVYLRSLIGAYHELAIMAHKTLVQVQELMRTKLNLVTEGCGTNGSRWFLESFRESHMANTLPSSISPYEASKLIYHAFAAQHYMNEEFCDRLEEVDWNPAEVMSFYAIYIEYLIGLTQFIEKVQKVRMFKILARFSGARNKADQVIGDIFSFELIYKCRHEILDIRKKAVSVRGVAQYFSRIRRASVPGVGFAVLVLFMILSCWPFAKLSMPAPIRFRFFCGLYGLGISALFESAIFLLRILWDRRSGKGRPS